MVRSGSGLAAALVVLTLGLGGCADEPPAAAPTTRASAATTPATIAPTTSPPPTTAAPTTTAPATPTTPANGATPAPAWLGTRVLPRGPDGYGISPGTPPELRDRRIVTVDVLPPPRDGRFASTVTPVPDSVVRRSTWSKDCPVSLADLRYVTVSFRGFDGRAHTGELLLNRDAADAAVTAFRRLFAADFPIERMVITTLAERDAPPTGDGNTTAAFNCRPARGSTTWSQHAYGRAIDVNPFQNPYVRGRTVLPELATAYTDRGRVLPGVITPGSPAVAAFRAVGWTWGGSWSSPKDYMHFSANGR